MLRKLAKRLIRGMASNDYQPLNRIELSRQNLLHNVRYMQKRHSEHAIIPVLKSNAYGHGLTQIATILNDADVAFLAVDGYFEAAQIKDISRHRLLVMGYIASANVRLLDTKRCSFVVQDISGLRALSLLRRPVSVHLELNTGMNRLGLNREELDAYLDELKTHPNLHLEGVMTHLADADNNHDSVFTAKQVEAFDRAIKRILAAGFTPAYFHIAQTAGSTKASSRYANALRLGIGIYGINPLQPKDSHFKDLQGLKPVLSLTSTVVKTYDLQKGDRVSYNGIFTAPGAMRIGVLPLGYYEGMPWELSNKGIVMSKGQSLPVVGRVCMNHTMIDLQDSELAVGDEVTVISNDSSLPNSIFSVMQTHNIFFDNWLVHISSSIRRVIY